MKLNVSAPAIRPHSHNILNVAEVHRGQRSEDGVTFNPNGCEVIFAHQSGCWVGDDKAVQGCHLAEFGGYVLEMTLGFGADSTDESPESHLEKAFTVGAPAVIERLAELGVAGVAAGTNVPVPAGVQAALSVAPIVGKLAAAKVPPFVSPTLAAGVLVTPAQTNAKQALGLIEAKLVDGSDHIGGAGTILMSPLEFVSAVDAITEDGGQLVTKATGSKVVVGNIAPGHIYGVIGDMDVWLGPVEIVDAFQRPRNESIVQAEMFVAFSYNTCVALRAATV